MLQWRHATRGPALSSRGIQASLANHALAQRAVPSRWACSQSKPEAKQCHKTPTHVSPSMATAAFWASKPTWRRAAVNTFRCLIGCTAGDFSSMWYLQAFHADMGITSIMAISMVSGVSTSMLLETVLLRYGRDLLPWQAAFKTAAGMSMISMLTMELAQNTVDYHLTGGVVDFQSPSFWAAAVFSIVAGFMTPVAL